MSFVFKKQLGFISLAVLVFSLSSSVTQAMDDEKLLKDSSSHRSSVNAKSRNLSREQKQYYLSKLNQVRVKLKQLEQQASSVNELLKGMERRTEQADRMKEMLEQREKTLDQASSLVSKLSSSNAGNSNPQSMIKEEITVDDQYIQN